ncbi:MarR family winged helix-turn-helix transcriptional regulator [Nocardia sp. NPDC051030]|uniref:MarR family winged helix-turn-helix transcriptional regulator n=1 Tax=Nocardia sp. NPDC051030 TaxID=3155162 RepID=UPI003445AF34
MVKSLTNPLSDRPAPLGNLLSAAARTLAAELDAGLIAAGFTDVRAAHAPIFQVIDPDGTRLVDLAQRTGMTKQAMGELVRHLEARGYVEILPDPSDKRARLARLTEHGWSLVHAGLDIVARFDARLDAIVGAAEVAQLREVLMKIIGGAGLTFAAGDTAITQVMITE